MSMKSRKASFAGSVEELKPGARSTYSLAQSRKSSENSIHSNEEEVCVGTW